MKEGDRVIHRQIPERGSGVVINASESYRQIGVCVVRWDGDPRLYAENLCDLRVVSPLEDLAWQAE